ncbi:MAG TPA: GntR family transcriptional regulator [Solirubrobacteraceae bacterium]|nr:GntR family transcriptional regulator [Solirubrobacteraceae bacterium]
MPLAFDPVAAAGRPPSAAARAYAYVKERLLDGRFAGGTLLSENELARRLGISRTPVREAFRQLEAEDLLELYPRRGALVIPISPSEADDVLEARLLIEQHCARRVAAYGAEVAPALREAIAEQERSLAAGGTGFAAADRRFHRTIVIANGNALLTRQYDTLRDRLERIAALAAARDPERIARFIAEHAELTAAIERGDADVAAELTGAHLRGAHALARRPRSAGL